jgi:hypothetical protein
MWCDFMIHNIATLTHKCICVPPSVLITHYLQCTITCNIRLSEQIILIVSHLTLYRVELHNITVNMCLMELIDMSYIEN